MKQNNNFLLFVIFIVVVQIFLEVWTSTNYAATSCGNTFPTCLGQWWPEDIKFSNISYWGALGIDYEYGVLENGQRIAIQMLHRIGALVTTLMVISLIFKFKQYAKLRIYLFSIFFLLSIQITLGILNVVLSLPILIAVAHNLTALLLLLSLIALKYKMTLCKGSYE